MRLKSRSVGRAMLALVVAATLPGPSALAGELLERARPAGVTELVLNQGRKWPTDARVRQGMESIRSAIAAELDALNARAQANAHYNALAAQINAEVAQLSRNQLDPAAAAQLHLVLTELVMGTGEMQGWAASRGDGVRRVLRALDAYGRHFDHPGWKRLAA